MTSHSFVYVWLSPTNLRDDPKGQGHLQGHHFRIEALDDDGYYVCEMCASSVAVVVVVYLDATYKL